MFIERFCNDPDIELVERADGNHYITGYAVVWYDGTTNTEFQLGENRVERIERKAFEKVLSSNDVVEARFNHDRNFVLDDTSKTLKLNSDIHGLRYTLPYDSQDPDHQKVKSKIRKGLIRGSSFAADVAIKWHNEGNKSVATITDVIRLQDVSPVDKPAYTATSATMRDYEDSFKEYQKAMEETNKRIEKLNTI